MEGTNKEQRITNIEEWIVDFVNIISDTLPPSYTEDLRNITIEKMDLAFEVRKAKANGETLIDD